MSYANKKNSIIHAKYVPVADKVLLFEDIAILRKYDNLPIINKISNFESIFRPRLNTLRNEDEIILIKSPSIHYGNVISKPKQVRYSKTIDGSLSYASPHMPIINEDIKSLNEKRSSPDLDIRSSPDSERRSPIDFQPALFKNNYNINIPSSNTEEIIEAGGTPAPAKIRSTSSIVQIGSFSNSAAVTSLPASNVTPRDSDFGPNSPTTSDTQFNNKASSFSIYSKKLESLKSSNSYHVPSVAPLAPIISVNINDISEVNTDLYRPLLSPSSSPTEIATSTRLANLLRNAPISPTSSTTTTARDFTTTPTHSVANAVGGTSDHVYGIRGNAKTISMRSSMNSTEKKNFALKDFPFRGKSWCRRAKATSIDHGQAPVIYDRAAGIKQLQILKSIKQQIQQENATFTRYLQSLSGENMVLSNLVDSSLSLYNQALDTKYGKFGDKGTPLLLKSTSGAPAKSIKSANRFHNRNYSIVTNNSSYNRANSSSIFVDSMSKSKIDPKKLDQRSNAPIIQVKDMLYFQLHLACCNHYYQQEKNHTSIAITDLINAPEHLAILQQQLTAQQQIQKEVNTNPVSAPSAFRNMASFFSPDANDYITNNLASPAESPRIPPPPPEPNKFIEDSPTTIPSFHIDELDDFKSDEILPSRFSYPIYSNLISKIPLVERCYFRVSKLNKFSKNTPRLLELDFKNSSLAICKKKDFEKSEDLAVYSLRDFVISRSNYMSINVYTGDPVSSNKLAIQYSPSNNPKDPNASKIFVAHFETPEERERCLKLFLSFILKMSWEYDELTSFALKTKRSQAQSINAKGRSLITRLETSSDSNNVERGLIKKESYCPNPIFISLSRPYLLAHLRQVQKDLPIAHLAQDFHHSWVDRKLIQGWRFGVSYDLKSKLHPHLVSYSKLDLDVRRFKKSLVLFTLEAIFALGFSIKKRSSDALGYNDYESLLHEDLMQQSGFAFQFISSLPSLFHVIYLGETRSNSLIPPSVNFSDISPLASTYFTSPVAGLLHNPTKPLPLFTHPSEQLRPYLSVISSHNFDFESLSASVPPELAMLLDVLAENYHDCLLQKLIDNSFGSNVIEEDLEFCAYGQLEESERVELKSSMIFLIEALVGLGFGFQLACDPSGSQCRIELNELPTELVAPASTVAQIVVDDDDKVKTFKNFFNWK